MGKSWLTKLLSELHRESLKPAGFRKKGKTFSRECDSYQELYNFQSSSGSSSAECVFYLNVGIAFSDYELDPDNWVLFKDTHWAGRIEDVVRGAPSEWSCDESTDRDKLKARLTKVIQQASKEISTRLDKFLSSYLDSVEN